VLKRGYGDKKQGGNFKHPNESPQEFREGRGSTRKKPSRVEKRGLGNGPLCGCPNRVANAEGGCCTGGKGVAREVRKGTEIIGAPKKIVDRRA